MSDWIRGSLVIVLVSLLGCSGGGGADDLMRRARRSTAEPETAEAADAGNTSTASANTLESGSDSASESGSSDAPMTPESATDAAAASGAGAATGGSVTEAGTSAPDLGISPDRLASDPGVDTFEDYRKRMEEIGRALAAEMAETKYVPAPSMMDNDGNPTLSWRVRILPKLGYDELYRRFKLNEPWNSPNNMALLSAMPKIYRSGSREVGKTGFLFPRARYTLFRTGGGSLPGLPDIADGVGATVMMVMASPTRAVPWTAPEDYLVDEGNDVKDLALSERDTYLVMWADGRAVEIRSGAVGGEYRKMMTFGGREPFSPRDIEFGVEAEVSAVRPPVTEEAASPSPGLGGPATPSVSLSLDLPNRLSGASLERIATGDWEHAAELALLAELLRDESSADLRGVYLPATGGLVPFVRIGLGATVPLSPRTPDANPIRIERNGAAVVKRAPQELETLTGDLGEAVVADLWKEMEAGRLGGRQLPAETSTGGTSPSKEQRFISLGVEYLGNDRLSTLLDGARYRGLDLLIHFDVELTVTRQNITANTTVVRVHDVRTGKKLFESPPINNIREMRAEANVADESVLAKARVKFQEFLTASVSLKSDYEPTPDEVRARVTQVTEKIERPDWVAALEVREYFRRGLISRVEFEQAYYALLKVDAQSFAAADPEARFEALLTGQDASLVLIAREAKSWEPKPVAAGGAIDE